VNEYDNQQDKVELAHAPTAYLEAGD